MKIADFDPNDDDDEDEEAAAAALEESGYYRLCLIQYEKADKTAWLIPTFIPISKYHTFCSTMT